ncbi:hypothetical protein PVAP13_1NG133819 [Panicum virgatum]|uniref:DUF7595 domain-containing protein n=1 Tax=Panicum virgatum TaxID=38727 RepID=A0A8T0WLG2_PANVG|nr:hypothetical protein PVAP13_1NG133819 [Panicum virgatum]
MPPRKRRRAFTAPPSPDQATVTTPRRPPEEEAEPPALPTLPPDLLPEIAARSDVTTLVHFAASCRALRRDILRPAGFHPPRLPRARYWRHRHRAAVRPRLPARLRQGQDGPRPGPAAAAGAALLLRGAPGDARRGVLLREAPRAPLAASRNGLVVLRRRYLAGDRSSDICVYDPMSGGRTFLPSPPDIRIRDRKASDYGVYYTYVLLAAADGIGGSSFLVLAADFTGLEAHSANITVQTVSPDNADGTCPWGPVTMVAHPRSRWCSLQPQCSAVVFRGLIHWLIAALLHPHPHLYDVRTAMAGSIEVPKRAQPQYCCKVSNLHLASSPDGRLSLHVANKLKISVWLQRPAGAGAGWSRHAVIDIATTARFLTPPGTPYYWSGAILLRPFTGDDWPTDKVEEEEEVEEALAVLDMETKELRRRVIKKKHITLFPYEIDLEARLSAMKMF